MQTGYVVRITEKPSVVVERRGAAEKEGVRYVEGLPRYMLPDGAVCPGAKRFRVGWLEEEEAAQAWYDRIESLPSDDREALLATYDAVVVRLTVEEVTGGLPLETTRRTKCTSIEPS